MNWTKFFKAQKQLDDHIVKEKGLEGQDLLDKKILALQVELGELANEWRGFKFWSDNQTAITLAARKTGNGKGETYNPLLEEYVDCLHFILSVGLELEMTDVKPWYSKIAVAFGGCEITKQFNDIFNKLGDLYAYRTNGNYLHLFSNFLGLGEMLGFTWEQIEQAYFAKNKINFERQANGY